MSLGSWFHTKSIVSTIRRRLAPPRDILQPHLVSYPGPFSHSIHVQTDDFTHDRLPVPYSQHTDSKKLDRSIVREPEEDGARPKSDQTLFTAINRGDIAHEITGVQSDGLRGKANDAVLLRKVSTNITSETATKAGLSERQYARWKATLEKSRRNKEDKEKRRTELRNSTELDWHDTFNFLKKRTIVKTPKQDLVRLRWSTKSKLVSEIRGDHIPKPPRWSVFAFRNYVEDLVSSSVSPLLHRQLYIGEETHDSVIAEQLRKHFGNPTLERYWSVEACNLALAFFYRRSMMTEARELYSRMEDRKYLTSTETFNVMLMACASRKDLATFNGLLNAMDEKRLKPNAQTWEAFFLVNSSSHIRHQIYQSMRDRGILNDLHTMKNFLTLNIRETFCTQLDRGHSATSFLEYMDKLEEIKWLSPSIGNILLHEIGKRGSAKAAMDLFGQLESRGMEFDDITLDTLLHLCRPNRNHDLAIHILDRFHQHNIHPDKKAYESIFQQFWRSRLLNCAKVTWRYACVTGQASYAMRKLIGQNIRCGPESLPEEPFPSRRDAWRCLAAHIIVGLDDKGLPRITSFRRPLVGRDDVTALGKGADARQNLQALLEEDLASAAHRYGIRGTLSDLLTEALAKDRQWANEHVWRYKDKNWFIENSIPIKLKYTGARSLRPSKAGQEP